MRDPRLEGGGAAAPPPFDTFTRVRAQCTGADYIDLDKHAAQITEVVALAKLRDKQFFTGRNGVQAP
jgi:hypothetical protein